MITVNTEQFTAQIDAWVEKAKGRTRDFAVEFIQDMNLAVTEATPVITGYLRSSWYADLNTLGAGGTEPIGDPVAKMNLVGSNLRLGDIYYALNGAAYAWYVEYGTAAHDIVPVQKRALHWVADGHDMFATRVHHPGTPPRAFVRGTVARAPLIADIVAKRVGSRP